MIKAATYIPHRQRNQFLTPLECQQVGNSVNWIITRDLRYADFRTEISSSFPPVSRRIFASISAAGAVRGAVSTVFPILLASPCGGWFFPEALVPLWVSFVVLNGSRISVTDEIAVVHDFLYATRDRGYWKANWILFKGMTAPGTTKPAPETVKWWQWIFVRAVPRNWLWKRLLIYINVTLFGWIPWIEDARKARRNKTC